MNRLSPLFFSLLVLTSCAHSRIPVSAPLRSGGSRGSSCSALDEEKRTEILAIADPENFPATRYRRGPSSLTGIEKETDCSHFVHEVYRRAGLPYAFRTTRDLANAREFDLLPERNARPGDLMLFRGHVGIVADDGRIISALRTRHRKRKSSIEALDRSNFRSFRGRQRYVLRYRCQP
ncbi:MAG TPA: NlpC/P60 family protein [Bdellovibrionota bacterium]|jgi:cell wall-associated NlpC family hydrolase